MTDRNIRIVKRDGFVIGSHDPVVVKWPNGIDPCNVSVVTAAVARGLRKLHTPHPVALPEDDAADLSDDGWRAILDRFEKQYAADKSGEAER